MKEGVKYNNEAIKPNGEPLAPKKIADKFIRQCGVLVKDQLPISLQEWREPAKPRPGVTFVDDRQKLLLWETLMEHFTLPDHFTEADGQKVKDAALRKMAVAFNNHKNREWAKYVKGGRKTPVFEGILEKQSAHWDDFVKFKDSELSKERSRINKANAAKKDKFHKLGPGGYAVGIPKWDKSEKEMEDAGFTPEILSCPPGAGLGSMHMGGSWTRRQAKFPRRHVWTEPKISYLLQ